MSRIALNELDCAICGPDRAATTDTAHWASDWSARLVAFSCAAHEADVEAARDAEGVLTSAAVRKAARKHAAEVKRLAAQFAR